jgi:hypothetical protein
MPELRIGTADLPPRLAPQRYFAGLRFLESALCLRGVPSDKVLRRWQKLAPPRGLALVAPRTLTDGKLSITAERRAELDAFAAAAATLDAAAVVFRTSTELTPSSAGRDALRRFFAELAPAERFAGMDRVWQPAGLWELSATAVVAPELDVLCAFDPLFEDPGVDLTPAIAAHLERGAAYFRPTAMGRPRGELKRDDLETLLALVEPLERAIVVFATQDSWRAARSFRKLAIELGGEGPEVADDEDDEDEGAEGDDD